MAYEMMEGAVNAVKNYLEANMAARLDLLDAEYSDFVLEDIQIWAVAELTAIPKYPAIIILGDYSSIEGEGEGWMQSDHSLVIACLATDQDTERLRRRLYRYIRAATELLKSGRSSLGYTINFDRLEFSPLYGREGTFMSDARLMARLKKYES